MSTLILGFTISDLCFAVLALPLMTGLVTLGLAMAAVRRGRPCAAPVVAALAIGGPLITGVLIALMIFMLSGAPDGLVVGPYGEWFRTRWGVWDVTFWLDPLAFGFALVATLLVLVLSGFAWDPAPESRDAGARRTALLHGGLFFFLFGVWAESVSLYFVAWQGLAVLTGLFFCLSREAQGGRQFFWLSLLGFVALFVGVMGFADRLATGGATDFVLSFAALQDHAAPVAQQVGGAFLLVVVFGAGQLPLFWMARAGRCHRLDLAWMAGAGLPTLSCYWLARTQLMTQSHPPLFLGLEMIGAVTAVVAAGMACRLDSSRRIIAALVPAQVGLVLVAFATGAVLAAVQQAWLSGIALVLLLCALQPVSAGEGDGHRSHFWERVRQRPWECLAAGIAGVSLAGILPIAGFFSRVTLLWNALSQERYVTGSLLLLASVLTVMAVTRLLVRNFSTSLKSHAVPRADRSLWHIALLFVLSLVLLGAPFVLGSEFFWSERAVRQALLAVYEDHVPIRSMIYSHTWQRTFVLLSFGLFAAVAMLTGYRVWRRPGPRRAPSLLQRWADNDLYLARGYEILVVRPLDWIASKLVRDFVMTRLQEQVAFAGLGTVLRLSGQALLRLQTGFVQHYVFWITVIVAGVISWVLL